MGLLERKPGETRRSAPGTGETRLTLAAFGKHPGWADHMDGIGIDTETLARVRQLLYDRGITEQNNSEAWEKLNAEKRIEGFNHCFLWITPAHTVLGLMWSSSDSKGRSKYPMVLCVDGEGVTTDFVFTKVLPELERLRTTCQATASSDQVGAECRNTQNRLRGLLGAAASSAQPALSVDARGRFLESGQLGPDRVGLLRVLYELMTVLGSSSGKAAANLRSRHMRLPATTTAGQEVLLLWAAFLSCALPATVPFLLLMRPGLDWLDVVVAEPAADDFFCLQASPKALPLTTAIAYQLSSDLKPLLQGIEARFLKTDNQPALRDKPFPPLSPAAQITPSIPASTGALATEPAKRRSRWWAFWLGGLLLALAAGLAWFVLSRSSAGPKPNPAPSQPAPKATASNAAAANVAGLALSTNSSPTTPAASGLVDSSSNAARTRELVQAGQTAMNNRQYKDAQKSFTEALKIRPGDSAFSAYLAGAKQAQTDADFDAALAGCKGALAAGRIDDARNLLATANELKPNDPRALQYSVQLSQLQQAKQQEQYAQSIAAARQAMAAANPDQASVQATAALDHKPGDAAARQVLQDATRMKQAGAQYQSAMDAGRSAFNRNDYTNAMTQADLALAARRGDPAGMKFKTDAQAQLDLVRAQAEKYQQAMQAAHRAYEQKDYASVTEQTGVALAIRTNDAEALGLKRDAQAGQDLKIQDAQNKAADPAVPAKSTGSGANAPTDLSGCDSVLRNLMIQLRVTPAKHGVIQTNGATASPLPRGSLPQETIDWYVLNVETLRKRYQDHNWLDPERDEDLKHLKTAIRSWNE